MTKRADTSQDRLPGGHIADTAARAAGGRRTWTGTGHAPDRRLERTAVRWVRQHGWYIVTCRPGSADAGFRHGPSRDMAEAARVLRRIADANALEADCGQDDTQPMTDKAGEETLKDRTDERITSIVREGLVQRIKSAGTAWSRTTGSMIERQILRGIRYRDHHHNPLLDIGTEDTPRELSTELEELTAAAAAYDDWTNG